MSLHSLHRSHHNGAKAHAEGLYEDEIIPYEGSTVESGIRGEATYEKMASLKPAFVKPFGSVTAGLCVCFDSDRVFRFGCPICLCSILSFDALILF